MCNRVIDVRVVELLSLRALDVQRSRVSTRWCRLTRKVVQLVHNTPKRAPNEVERDLREQKRVGGVFE